MTQEIQPEIQQNPDGTYIIILELWEFKQIMGEITYLRSERDDYKEKYVEAVVENNDLKTKGSLGKVLFGIGIGSTIVSGVITFIAVAAK